MEPQREDPVQRRQHPRIPLRIRFSTSNVDGSAQTDLTSMNISLGGVFLETPDEKGFEMGTPILLQLDQEGEGPLRVLGEVVYILGRDVTAESNLTPGLGIKFVHLSDDQRSRLMGLLAAGPE
mgnify:FL=1